MKVTNLPETAIGPIATQWCVIDGIEVRYARSPIVPGTIPILLTAPWPESLFAFHAVWDAFAATASVIAVDLPGFGLSEGRDELFSPSAMAEFLVGILDDFGLSTVHAVVPDIGTLAALFAASAHPERFASIVGGSGGIALDLLGESLLRIVDSSRADFAGVDGGEQVVALVRQTMHAPLPEAVIEDYRMSSRGERWNRAADFVRAYRRDLPALAAALPSIAVPVLVISGNDDPFVPPSNGAFLKKHLPVCEAVVIEAGHFVWEEAPGSYAEHALSWIASHAPRVPADTQAIKET